MRPTRQPSPWVAAFLSALIPGLGQLYAGERGRGRRLLLIDLALLAFLVVAFLFFQSEVLKAWASLSSLALIMVANITLLSYRAWAAYDAYHSIGGVGPAGMVGLASGLVVFAVVMIPHFALGYLNVVQYSLISDVFAPSPTTTIPTAAPGTTEPGQTTTTTPGPTLWDGLERLNIVLLGSDRSGSRTDSVTLIDTVILVSIDPDSGDAAMISLPRNMTQFPLPPDHGYWDCDCFPQLLNDLYQRAVERPDAFPGSGDPGARAMKAAVGHLLGVEVHYYAMINMDGFVGLVDAFGGVDINVPRRIVDEEYPHEDGSVVHMVIEAGPQRLDGHHALAYARIRRHADDFARMNRQRCILGALVEQSSPLEVLARYGAIAEVLRNSLVTDIPRDQLPDFIDLLPKLGMERIGVLLVDTAYSLGQHEVRGTLYDLDRIHSEAQAIIADPTTGASANLEQACD
jgi:polyisoprenyl-teichoic acid--peptidoglycan teichoic acid transferase